MQSHRTKENDTTMDWNDQESFIASLRAEIHEDESCVVAEGK